MTWTVTKVGTGTAQYSEVEILDGGVLRCYAWGRNNLGRGNVPVAYYGPGMWVSAVNDEA